MVAASILRGSSSRSRWHCGSAPSGDVEVTTHRGQTPLRRAPVLSTWSKDIARVGVAPAIIRQRSKVSMRIICTGMGKEGNYAHCSSATQRACGGCSIRRCSQFIGNHGCPGKMSPVRCDLIRVRSISTVDRTVDSGCENVHPSKTIKDTDKTESDALFTRSHRVYSMTRRYTRYRNDAIYQETALRDQARSCWTPVEFTALERRINSSRYAQINSRNTLAIRASHSPAHWTRT